MRGQRGGRVLRQAGVIAAGFALGVGGIALFRGDRHPSYRPHPPSVKEFSFSTSLPEAPPRPPDTVVPPAVEPADPPGAVAAFLRPLAENRPQLAYSLLDDASRKRFPSVASWVQAQADRPQPLTFEVGSSRPNAERPDAVEVDVSATHRPSLDATRGLVPARSSSVWLVRQEGGAWRVAADPLRFRPVFPADAAASGVVQGWVSLLAACQPSAAAELQVNANLYGPASLAKAPCEQRGTWTAGEPSGLDRTPDPKAFLAAFGPDVSTWARLVPVQGPGGRFLAAVAPLGDSWRVMGVAVDGG